ncbi:hypothetical protein XH99_22075 [Bradyrhizobium nanningense]|uniref:Uncharacterized protein n=1 Tax=Bradyrhizobium nanningense TaxID=1325118 RepID=A0A4Q0S147_9BRAD|nr:hypothetical protein XH99_22075 [Bradyrhizobium nanningense]RXH29887.1 hypothetical protein XH84_20100 [Bradyrhizobium nanningense]
MPIVIIPHLRDRELIAGSILLLHQREEFCLFLLHVLLQLGLDGLQRVGKSLRHLGMTGVDSLDFPGQARKLRQFAPMRLVIAGQDVIDQRAGCFGRRTGFPWIERVERLLYGCNVQSALADGFGQEHVAAATEVELEPPEHRGRTGQCRGDFSDGTISKRGFSRHCSGPFRSRYGASGRRRSRFPNAKSRLLRLY